MEYQVMCNGPSGSYYYIEHPDGADYPRQEGFYSEYCICFSKEEAKQIIEDLKGDHIFVVSVNYPSCKVNISEEREHEGTWRSGTYVEDRPGHKVKYDYIDHFKNREEANELANQYKERFLKRSN